VPPSYQNS